MVIVPALAKMKPIVTVSPPCSGLASPDSITLGTGPLRLTSESAGRLTAPPVIDAWDATPLALTDSSRSPSVEYRDKKTPVRPPATAGPLGEAPRTNTLENEIPFWVLSPVKLAGWYCSVGAFSPASQPASTGTSTTMAPNSRRRFQRV